jgi:hypothetical protein
MFRCIAKSEGFFPREITKALRLVALKRMKSIFKLERLGYNLRKDKINAHPKFLANTIEDLSSYAQSFCFIPNAIEQTVAVQPYGIDGTLENC